MAEYDIVEMINAAVDRYADRPAIIGAKGVLTYHDVEIASNRLSNLLLLQGAAPSDRVAILAGDGVFTIPAILGVLKAGCAFVPLDVRLPRGRLKEMLRVARARWCFCRAGDLPLAAGIKEAAAEMRVISSGDPADAEASLALGKVLLYDRFDDDARPSVTMAPDALAYIYSTSGSTGVPKAIAGRYAGIGHYVRWEISTLNLQAGVRVSQVTPPSFDASMRDFFTTLAAGGTVCLAPSYTMVWDGAALVRYLAESGVNLLHCVSHILRGLLKAARPGALGELKFAVSTADVLFPSDVRRWYEVFGESARLLNVYGPTESTMTKFFHFVRPEDADARRVPVGQPMDGAQAIIVDGDRVCPPGEAGEILIRSRHLALGYFEQPELTREAFLPDTFGADAGAVVYRTGDVGLILPDGSLDLIGRRDRQVKVGGVRTELGEVESLILESGQVDEAAVVAFDDPAGDKYLHAYVVAPEGWDSSCLSDLLADRLHAAAVPRGFTVLKTLPRTATGKIDRRALPPPISAEKAAGADDAIVAFGVESALAAIWREVLKSDRVTRDDNFFALGGDSLAAAMTAARLARLGINVSLRAVFEHPDLKDLAAHIIGTRTR